MQDFNVDFIGIGAPRCATTWLYRCLDEHPKVCMSRPKELNFFAERNPYTPSNGNLGWEWYQSRFSHWKEGQLRGEISPHYIATGAAKHIAEKFPNTKLLLLLRNPVDALFDLYQFHSHLRKVAPTFEEFIEKEPAAVDIYDYARHIKEYLRYFKREQISVHLFDDVASNGQGVLHNVFQFLSIRDIRATHADQNVNAQESNISRILGKGLSSFLKHAMERTFLNRFYMNAIHLEEKIEAKIAKLQKRHGQSLLRVDTRKGLQQHYAKSNEELEYLLGIKTAQWNTTR